MMRFLPAAAVIILGMAALPAVAEDYVVIESSMQSLAVGATLSSGAKLDVPQQQRVVLMAASGQVVAVNGPFQGPPPAPGSGPPQGAGGDVLKIVPTLLGKSDERQTPGVARALDWHSDAIKTVDEALAVDVSDGGDKCIYDPGHVAVIHNPDKPGTMKVQSMTDGAEAALKWDRGALRQPWPSTLPLKDGDMFSFERAGEEQASVATIHLLPPPPSGAGDVQRALQMARAGCDGQARLLLAVIAKAAK
ncbi:MAG TPA: hypothetical protein VN802_04580 [Stellaceae bacterium]|nr:hypothetical protein [Stellaceae bacterium]